MPPAAQTPAPKVQYSKDINNTDAVGAIEEARNIINSVRSEDKECGVGDDRVVRAEIKIQVTFPH